MFLFVEAKTTLSDAMADERFVEQFTKYTPAIERNLFLDTSKYSLLLLIGGRETDIYPETNRNCTGKTGNLSSRFYNLVLQSETKIPFITATALWLLSIHYLSNNNFSVNQFLIQLFSDNNCYGLVSAGKIIYEPSTGTFNIVKVNLDKI